jgi:hypothetical protein
VLGSVEDQVRAGLFDGAEIAISLVHWDDPDSHGEIRLRRGSLASPAGPHHRWIASDPGLVIPAGEAFRKWLNRPSGRRGWSWKGSASTKLHAGVLAEANGWCTLMTNSAKSVNIIAGYGYEPLLAPMDRCIRSAIAGRIRR